MRLRTERRFAEPRLVWLPTEFVHSLIMVLVESSLDAVQLDVAGVRLAVGTGAVPT